jgi:hypothetical protein
VAAGTIGLTTSNRAGGSCVLLRDKIRQAAAATVISHYLHAGTPPKVSLTNEKATNDRIHGRCEATRAETAARRIQFAGAVEPAQVGISKVTLMYLETRVKGGNGNTALTTNASAVAPIRAT